eukprot:314459-Alexandrium_andersonii.AAC.1
MPVRRHTPMAALLSAQTSRGTANPRSWAMAIRPSPAAVPFHDAGQLRLAGAQDNGLSGRRPMLYGTLTPHAHASARRPAGPKAPSKASVDERAEGGALILPRERVHAPGTDHQVADNPDEGRPVRGRRGCHAPTTLLSSETQIRAIHAK